MMTITCNTINYDEDYDPEDLAESVCSYADGLDGQDINIVSRRVFDSGFTPSQLTVNGRKGRRVGCVVAEDRVTYLVFDLDQEEYDEGEEEGEEEGEGEEGGMVVDNGEGESDYE